MLRPQKNVTWDPKWVTIKNKDGASWRSSIQDKILTQNAVKGSFFPFNFLSRDPRELKNFYKMELCPILTHCKKQISDRHYDINLSAFDNVWLIILNHPGGVLTF